MQKDYNNYITIKNYDIVVIGAGLSGLTSAYHIKKKHPNLSILIIEAKSRIGGRTQSIELKVTKDGHKKSKWDIGAQWVSDKQTHITKLLKELRLETYQQHKIGQKVLEANGKIIRYDSSIPRISISSLMDLKWIVTKFNIGSKRLNTIFPFQNNLLAHHLDSINLDQYLYSNSISTNSRAIVESTIKLIFGCESSQLNALYALTYAKSCGDGKFETLTDSAQEKRVKGGCQQISEKLLDFILEAPYEFNLISSSQSNRQISNRILLDTQVVEISQNEFNKDGVKVCVVSTQNIQNSNLKEKFVCKKVISSIPLNQYVNIKFDPELPMYKKNVFNNVHFGNMTKFVITYERAFWRHRGFSGEIISDGSIMNLNEDMFNQFYQNESDRLTFNKQMPSIGPITCMFDATNNENEPALVGFLCGRSSVEWADIDVSLRKNEVINAIVRYFGDEEARNYLDYAEKNWSLDSFSGGFPSLHISAGNVLVDYARATREPFMNIHFCSTESATEWQGYIEGAVQSGERTANEVLYSMLGSFSTCDIDYEKTFYYQKQQIDNIVKKNNGSRIKSLSLSLIAKYFIYISLILVASYFFLIFFRN